MQPSQQGLFLWEDQNIRGTNYMFQPKLYILVKIYWWYFAVLIKIYPLNHLKIQKEVSLNSHAMYHGVR